MRPVSTKAVAAWLKQSKDEAKIATLCDVAMDGDRGTISAFPKLRFELGETIAKGGKACKIVIAKAKV